MFDFLFGKGYEARQLNRDTRVIIESAVRDYRPELVRDIATLVRDEREAVVRLIDERPERRTELRRELERKHRDARRTVQAGPLTAYTLMIIDLRARAVGDRGMPARHAIDAFIEEWARPAD